MISLDQIIKATKSSPSDIVAIYPYGSRVYGTASETSDYDFIVVAKNLPRDQGSDQFSANNVNINIYSQVHFQKQLDEHKIASLECYFLPQDLILLEKERLKWNYNKSELRSSISMKSDHSFVKAKKKMIIAKDFDPYIAKKSLFHSLRILTFGIQIATYKKIVNYQEANHYWHELVNCNQTDWDFYKEKYQPEFNKLKSVFREKALK